MMWWWLFMVGSALCYSIKGYIPDLETKDIAGSTVNLQNIETLNTVRVPLSLQGNFTFTGAQDGKYLLYVESPTIQYDWRCRLVIHDGELTANKVLLGHVYNDLGPELSYPLDLDGYIRLKPIVPRPTFSLWRMLRQPTVLMSVASLVFVMLVPLLMGSLDPEIIEEMRQQNAKNNELGEKLQNFDLAQTIADRRKKE